MSPSPHFQRPSSSHLPDKSHVLQFPRDASNVDLENHPELRLSKSFLAISDFALILDSYMTTKFTSEYFSAQGG